MRHVDALGKVLCKEILVYKKRRWGWDGESTPEHTILVWKGCRNEREWIQMQINRWLWSLPGYSHIPFCTWALAKGGSYSKQNRWSNPWKSQCANCNKASQEDKQFKACARCKAFHYCSKKCQVKHWKDGHKVDCKGHWIEEFFPNLRMTQNKM